MSGCVKLASAMQPNLVAQGCVGMGGCVKLAGAVQLIFELRNSAR
jgi:hypothetical protein